MRNKNIDIIRASALLAVIVYHIYVLMDFSFGGKFSFLNNFVKFGGEIGVTIFFIMSGYCIYYSIQNQIKEYGKFDFNLFIKKRLKRIFPEYLLVIIVVLLLTDGAVYLNIHQILTHIFFVHNLFPDTNGAISGALWTMGVIFQFYLIAKLLYDCVKKKPYLTLMISIIFTIVCKIIFYHFVLRNTTYGGAYYFIYGRQIVSCLDNFVLGMFLAKMSDKLNNLKFKPLLLSIGLITLLGFLYYYSNIDIYTDRILAYLFHTALAIILSYIIFIFLKMKISYNNIIIKIGLFIGKYEYSIYLWHMVIIQNLLNHSPILAKFGSLPKFLILLVITIIFGYFSANVVKKIDLEELKQLFIKNSKKIIDLTIILVIVICGVKALTYFKEFKEDTSAIINNKIIRHDTLEPVLKEINNQIKEDNYTYIYIDNLQEEGYMNFYRMQYYLALNKSVKLYNDYISTMYSNDYQKILEFFNELDVDYVIVREWDLLNEHLVNESIPNVYIYKKSDEVADNLKEILIPINGGDFK